jgi:hypothetical protein
MCHHSCLLQPACEGFPLPCSSAFSTPRPLATCLFCCYCLSFICFSFFPGWGSVCPGGYADLSQGVLGAAYLLTWWSASPKQVRSWRLAAQQPSWFLCLTWPGDTMRGLEVWRCQSFASSWWYFLPGGSPACLQEFTLVAILESFLSVLLKH